MTDVPSLPLLQFSYLFFASLVAQVLRNTRNPPTRLATRLATRLQVDWHEASLGQETYCRQNSKFTKKKKV